MNLYLIKETKAFVIQVTFLCAAVWTHRWWRGSCVLWSSALVWAQISGIHLSQLFSLWATCTRVFLPGLWAHSRLHVSSHNTDQLYQLRASSQVFLQDLLITPSHIVYPLAHQKSQNSVKSFISVKKKDEILILDILIMGTEFESLKSIGDAYSHLSKGPSS